MWLLSPDEGAGADRAAHSEDASYNYHPILQAAKDVCIDVKVEGSLPTAPSVASVVSCAIDECLTNTIKHADGETLFVRCNEEGGYAIVCFSNDGTPPSAPIVESGGLKNLRNMVESAGGIMMVPGAM
jgi:signal transduction histidine kinase